MCVMDELVHLRIKWLYVWSWHVVGNIIVLDLVKCMQKIDKKRGTYALAKNKDMYVRTVITCVNTLQWYKCECKNVWLW
jgi:hypothetical protein